MSAGGRHPAGACRGHGGLPSGPPPEQECGESGLLGFTPTEVGSVLCCFLPGVPPAASGPRPWGGGSSLGGPGTWRRSRVAAPGLCVQGTGWECCGAHSHHDEFVGHRGQHPEPGPLCAGQSGAPECPAGDPPRRRTPQLALGLCTPKDSCASRRASVSGLL